MTILIAIIEIIKVVVMWTGKYAPGGTITLRVYIMPDDNIHCCPRFFFIGVLKYYCPCQKFGIFSILVGCESNKNCYEYRQSMKKNPVYFLIAKTTISKTNFLAVKFGTNIKSTKNQGFYPFATISSSGDH